MLTLERPPRTFRPHPVLVVLMLLCAAWWGWVAWMVSGAGEAGRAVAGASGFTAFFLFSALAYGRSAITVDEDGLTFRGVWRITRARWAECDAFDILPGPLTLYVVRAAGRAVHFRNLYRHHRELAQHLLTRVRG
ncbi:MAG: hypothetical protein FJ086_19315 [Deltaproteobacteria bacterium]|nr:hypothetical protein [Deltaproteobacteria bacterium]